MKNEWMYDASMVMLLFGAVMWVWNVLEFLWGSRDANRRLDNVFYALMAAWMISSAQDYVNAHSAEWYLAHPEAHR